MISAKYCEGGGVSAGEDVGGEGGVDAGAGAGTGVGVGAGAGVGGVV